MDIQESIIRQTQVSIILANLLLSTNSTHSNVVFSPISLYVVLGLVAAGSRGQTLDQLLYFLKAITIDDLNALCSQLLPLVFADGRPNGGPCLCFVNGVWVEQQLPLKPSFKHVVESVYKAASYQVDFITKADEVTEEVNLWAEKQTSGLIEQILPAGAVTEYTRLVFANAVYFKGAWNEKFDPSKTKDYDFHLLNGNKVRAPFMTSNKKQLVSSYDGFKVLGLPYQQGQDKRRFTMYFYLPDAKHGLPSLIQKVGSGSDFLGRHVPYEKVEVERFLIPKFKISFAFEASEMLKELGLDLPFSEVAGLTEMVECLVVGRKLYVSSIHHKSFLEVNEEGTEAAAASAVVIEAQCLRNKVDFVADHPFLFVIREDTTGVVLFMGQVTDPRDS